VLPLKFSLCPCILLVGSPRLPAPSYASPALEVAVEDKSGTALACVGFIVITFMVARRRDNATGEGNTVSHDKIKAATRQRMAETGEPYAVARRAVIKQHEAAQSRSRQARSERAPKTVMGAEAVSVAQIQQQVAQMIKASGAVQAQQRIAEQVAQTYTMAKYHQQVVNQMTAFWRGR
jgi:hypothetical protein